jgi:DNA-binding NtrC family response regulator
MGKEDREVALPRIFVVHDSDAVRETLSIILGGGAEVRDLSPSECTGRYPVPEGKPALLIADGDNPPASVLQSLRAFRVPVIWLRVRPDDGPPIRDAGSRFLVLPKQFDGRSLLEQARELLRPAPERAPGGQPDRLSYPYVSKEAAHLARQAATSLLPVLIQGEAGVGRARVAGAIHAAGSSSRYLAIPPQSCTREGLSSLCASDRDVTLFVDDVATASDEVQTLLLEIAEAGGLWSTRGWLGIRLIAGAAVDVSGLGHGGSFSRDLYYRLSVFPITLAPLRERPGDIPALVRAVSADLCSALGCRPVAFTPRAMQRLTRYLWFGNLAELETVLARTISLTQKEVIDVHDLLFGFGQIATDQGDARNVDQASSRPFSAGAVDLIINELAHEFKNPLVTIKTFAQHLERLFEEEGGRDQLVRLTGEAVDRMDRALENLLQFTRFQEPVRSAIPLGTLLGPVLAEIGPLLSERRLVLDYRPPEVGLRVTVDHEQITYALENLLRAVVRIIGDGESISVSCASPGAVAIRLPDNGRAITRFAELLSAGDGEDQSALPLGFALARNLVKRNGGELDLVEHDRGAVVTVRLPANDDSMGTAARSEDGTTAGLDR